jgi:methyl-accepting chemotaxis protein
MGAEARSTRPGGSGPPRQRKLRNYLLDLRFQLKYTSMVVGVTLVVASILGALAYKESKGQTEALQVQLAMQPDLDARVVSDLDAWGRQRDQQILIGIIAGIFVLTLALGFTGIIVTHKLVGPAYKIKMLLRNVQTGHLKVEGSLRKGDELQDVFQAFHEMVSSLRRRQAEEVELLDAALNKAQATGTPEDVLRIFREVRDRMRAELE